MTKAYVSLLLGYIRKNSVHATEFATPILMSYRQIWLKEVINQYSLGVLFCRKHQKPESPIATTTLKKRLSFHDLRIYKDLQIPIRYLYNN